ncbi:MAG: ATP-binding protein, partial [bacterium]
KKTYKKIYSSLKYSKKCIENKDFDNDKVVYVSQLIDLIMFFFQPTFIALSKNFENTNQFIYFSREYQKVRNNLSHPGSSKIYRSESSEIIKYINNIISIIDDKYFWYESKERIEYAIKEFESQLDNNPFKIHNLNEIDVTRNKLICREEELKKLRELVIGKDKFYRKSGSVVLYGYGGVGKTALLLEFLDELIKDKLDNNPLVNMDFLLYFSNKEERLDYKHSTGELYIHEIRRQTSGFNDYKKKLYKYLEIDNDEKFKLLNLKGIIVIDNIETFEKHDKDKIFEFIKSSPRTIQYILTSRNEELCEDKIYIEAFSEVNHGMRFIEEYIKENDINIILNNYQKEKLIKASKGNTLILILALQRINDRKTSFDEIINELENVAIQNTEVIADFMYKNTFDSTIQELEDTGYNPIKLLRVISLYNEPVDMFSISSLSQINLSDVEKMCKKLTSKLILDKQEEFFILNEFANKFIFINLIPNELEKIKLLDKIRKHKEKTKKNLEKLENLKKENSLLSKLMEDWKPRTYIDKIAIAEVFNYHSRAKKIVYLKESESISQVKINTEIERLEEDFKKHELNTSHPYIRYQKARCFHHLIYNGIKNDKIKTIVRDYYQQAIIAITYEHVYSYIKNTKSYAILLMIYGTFLGKEYYDYENALKYMQESKVVFDSLNIRDNRYFKVVGQVCSYNYRMYNKTQDNKYLKQVKEYIKVLEANKKKHHSINKFLNWFYNIKLKKDDLILKQA